jgi:glycylpeptide N-tetradecanoyltransferase
MRVYNPIEKMNTPVEKKTVAEV